MDGKNIGCVIGSQTGLQNLFSLIRIGRFEFNRHVDVLLFKLFGLELLKIRFELGLKLRHGQKYLENNLFCWLRGCGLRIGISDRGIPARIIS
ncbi:hypothetical protein D3C86_1585980 [compost metagenome]